MAGPDANFPASRERAVVLVSGGLDSATVLAIAARECDVYPLTFDYGQRHSAELQAAAAVCRSLRAREPRIVRLDLRSIGGSALTADIDVPKDAAGAGGIPATYVPARNTLFLSYALAVAEVVGAGSIFIGVNAVDFSGYPDCRPAFIEAFQALANVATKAAVEGRPVAIRAPLISLSKSEIIRMGVELGVDYGLTHSCYDPVGGLACGRCDSCRIRLAGFRDSGIPDPAKYV